MIHPPLSATLYLTNHCQFNCTHCFLVDQKKINNNHLNFNLIQAILDDLVSHKIFMVVVSGGDPTLHPDFIKIIEEIKKRKLLPLVGINAVEYSESLKASLLSIGINHIQVSIDKLHNQDKSDSSNFRLLSMHLKSITTLINNGFIVTVAITVHNKNINECAEISKILFQNGVWKIKISFWDSTKLGIKNGYKTPEPDEQLSLVRNLSSICNAKDNFTFVGFDINKNNDIITNNHHKLPRMVIRSDGNLAFSETGNIITQISDKDIVAEYIKAKQHLATNKRTIILNNIIQKYNTALSDKKLGNTNEIIYKIIKGKKEINIKISDNVPPQEIFFLLIREVGCLILNLSNYIDTKNSVILNEWIVKNVSEFISDGFRIKLTNLLKEEKNNEFLKYFQDNIDDNFLQ